MKTTDEARFTREDYMSLPEGFPAELIDGMLVKEPSPTDWHQHLVLEIAILARARVGARRVLISPVDVFVDEENVLQPDVAVLPEQEPVVKGRERKAPPLVVVEVLSPSTRDRDRVTKSAIYLRAGVREVWLVDPESETIEILTDAGVRRFGPGEPAGSREIPGLVITARDLPASPE